MQLTLSHKLLGYALGRTVQGSDRLLIDKMTSAGDEATITDLATLIVTSGQFRNVAGHDPVTPAAAIKLTPRATATPLIGVGRTPTSAVDAIAIPRDIADAKTSDKVGKP